MKTALLLIPKLENTVNRHLYLNMCIDKAIAAGYMPLTPSHYDETNLNQDEFVSRMLPLVDAALMFVNFGIDQVMLNVIERIVHSKDLVYMRIPVVELEKVYSDPVSVLNDVARKLNLQVSQLKSKTREREIVDARRIYYRRCRETTKASYAEIGSLVGVDHATVMHGEKTAHSIREINELYEKHYGDPKKQKTAMECATVECSTGKPQIERPVLPFRSLDPREQGVPTGKSFMRSLCSSGYGSPFGGYRPHS